MLDELGHDKYQIVYPTVSILAEPSVAVVGV
jgi:ABC-type sulfate transport system substrate-binding protein